MTLKLLAQDTDDLKIVASALQDAILRVGDVRFDPVARSASFRVTRYRHEHAAPSRIESGVRVDGVMTLQSANFDRSNPEAYAVILDVSFDETDAPEGDLTLSLSGGGALRMAVEGLDIMLSDVGEARKTKSKPDHEVT